MAGVEVEVKSQLSKIIEDLGNIDKAAKKLSATLAENSENLGKKTKEETKAVENSLNQMQQFGMRVANKLKEDFQSLLSVASLAGGLKISSQFEGSVHEALELSDTVRRLGSVFGIASSQFAKFQTAMQKGLGDIGLSSEAAANALNGLAETPVRGQANLIAYAKAASELASIGNQKGQEGAIAKGMAGVITAKGGNANDQAQMQATTSEILQIHNATGKSITEISSALQNIYSKTNKDFQGLLKGGGSTTLATASLMAPGASAFLERFMSMDKNQRAGMQAQGLGNIMGTNGQLNAKAIADTMAEANRRMPGNAQGGLQTMGLSEDEAKGFIRLSEAMKENEKAINGASKQIVDLNDEYREGLGVGEAFKANINKVKGLLAAPLAFITQGASKVLGKTSESTGGAAAVTGIAAVAAAVLTSGGIKGIGKMLHGEAASEAKAQAIEALTGEHVQKVEVINFPEGEGEGGGMAEHAMGALKSAGGLAKFVPLVGAAAGGIGLGMAAAHGLDKVTGGGYGRIVGKPGELAAGLLEHKFNADDEAKAKAKYENSVAYKMTHKIHVEMKSPDLRQTPGPGRGASQ